MLLQSFGFERLVGLHSLRKMGMFTEQETAATNRQLAKVAAHLPKSSPFRTLCRKLGLVGSYWGGHSPSLVPSAPCVPSWGW